MSEMDTAVSPILIEAAGLWCMDNFGRSWKTAEEHLPSDSLL
eukprot:XP_001706770.1 Hypothetical protein GL50803_2460 [Giardia lamblia ATCC 50803]